MNFATPVKSPFPKLNHQKIRVQLKKKKNIEKKQQLFFPQNFHPAILFLGFWNSLPFQFLFSQNSNTLEENKNVYALLVKLSQELNPSTLISTSATKTPARKQITIKTTSISILMKGDCFMKTPLHVVLLTLSCHNVKHYINCRIYVAQIL